MREAKQYILSFSFSFLAFFHENIRSNWPDPLGPSLTNMVPDEPHGFWLDWSFFSPSFNLVQSWDGMFVMLNMSEIPYSFTETFFFSFSSLIYFLKSRSSCFERMCWLEILLTLASQFFIISFMDPGGLVFHCCCCFHFLSHLFLTRINYSPTFQEVHW